MPRMAETSAPIFIAPSAALVDALVAVLDAVLGAVLGVVLGAVLGAALVASLVSYSYGRFHLLWPFGRGNVV